MSETFPEEDKLWRIIVLAREAHAILVDAHAILVDAYMLWAESRVARICRRRGIPHAEVEGAAGDGLLRALKNFNPERGTPFTAFAGIHIDGAVLDFARRNDARQFEHGKRPKYSVGKLPDASDSGPSVEADLSPETRDMAEALVKALSGDVRRELFVRVALGEQNIRDTALILGMDDKTARDELAAARGEAAEFARNYGLSTPDTKPKGRPSGQREIKPTKTLEELIEMAAIFLSPSQSRESRRVKDATIGRERVLTAPCACGGQAVGPSTLRGPISVNCPKCGRELELR